MEKPGIYLKEFHIKNGRVFKDEKITLAKQGIVNVLGKNGVGKSTIFNLLQAPFFATTPTGHKKDDLVKNDSDSLLSISFDAGNISNQLNLKRKKKKWTYEINENSVDTTPHTYNDSVKKAASLLGITQAEFEGSVHLTQGSQHILISGKPTKRKEYISNFFGIDDSYDQIQLAAKEQLQKVKDEINKVSSLSHTKMVLEQELSLIPYKDPKAVEKKIKAHKNKANSLKKELDKLYKLLDDLALLKELLPQANYHKDPVVGLQEAENNYRNLKSEYDQLHLIEENNKQAKEVNDTIAELTETKNDILSKYSDIADSNIESLKKEFNQLLQLQYANQPLGPLRKELLTLKTVKALPVEDIEKELRKVHVDLLSSQKKLKAMERGECVECGSKFAAKDFDLEKSKYLELKENFAILQTDFETVKERNKKVDRRKYLVETIGDTVEFTEKDKKRLLKLQDLITVKEDYDEALKTLKILKPQKIKLIRDSNILLGDMNDVKAHITKLRECIEAIKRLPKDINESANEQEVYEGITELKNLQSQNENDLSTSERSLGEITANNERMKRLQKQLHDVVSQLTKLEKLKKDEFFWAKMVEAYGPKGLRVQQLNKMMEILIRRLPVYTSILFAEKGLSFEYECDANNISILACREETLANGEISKFKHDISSFSGGEKGKMSTAFVLTLADCVPPAKRTNCLILDEVDSALDADGQFRFTNDLLPMLKDHYESVFVVSHNEEIQQAAVYDQVWTVVKKNHWSTIERTTNG